MRSRRIRRESVYWVIGAVLAVALVWGIAQVGSTVFKDLGSWWKARLTARRAPATDRPVTVALIAIDSTKSDKLAIDLGAIQIVPKETRVRGITLMGNTFVEVPGQGFERAAEAFRGGPKDAMATVQNLLGVPLEHYIVIDAPEFKALAEEGRAAALFSRIVATDLSAPEVARLATVATKVKPGDALIIGLPVKSISLGQEIYYEAEKAKVADVLKAWWGVYDTPETRPLRIKILNGVGVPGIGGEAAKPLIKAGYRIIDTTNANTFDFKHTLIVMYRTDTAHAEEIRKVLGVGRIVHGTMAQDVVDVIVVVGKDFVPKP
jgi:hypothetical protein